MFLTGFASGVFREGSSLVDGNFSLCRLDCAFGWGSVYR